MQKAAKTKEQTKVTCKMQENELLQKQQSTFTDALWCELDLIQLNCGSQIWSIFRLVEQTFVSGVFSLCYFW